MEKAERQEKEKIEETQRREKELTEAIVAGETDANCIKEPVADTVQLSRTDMFRKQCTTHNRTRVAWTKRGYGS